jgi:hypothetical protein
MAAELVRKTVGLVRKTVGLVRKTVGLYADLQALSRLSI